MMHRKNLNLVILSFGLLVTTVVFGSACCQLIEAIMNVLFNIVSHCGNTQ